MERHAVAPQTSRGAANQSNRKVHKPGGFQLLPRAPALVLLGLARQRDDDPLSAILAAGVAGLTTERRLAGAREGCVGEMLAAVDGGGGTQKADSSTRAPNLSIRLRPTGPIPPARPTDTLLKVRFLWLTTTRSLALVRHPRWSRSDLGTSGICCRTCRQRYEAGVKNDCSTVNHFGRATKPKNKTPPLAAEP